MKLTHDREHNIAYLQIGPADREVETRQLSEDINLDIGPDGEICGLEFLDANRQLALLSAKSAGAGMALRFEVFQDLAGGFRFRVLSGAGSPFFSSEAFASEAAAAKAVELFRNSAVAAPVDIAS